MKEKVDQLVNWLKEQVEKANVDGLLVGVSGGVDSAVVAHLIKKACPDRSLGVIMPCQSNPKDVEDALKVVNNCNLDHTIIDLTETKNVLFSTIEKQLSEKGEWKEERRRLGDANMRARLRMTTLYTVANNYRYLVVGTDNAAEWYTGYFTKFGDGGVDLVPLVHFTKGEVRKLAKELGVPQEIIERAPTAGLWEGQTDEEEMGTTYEMIDKFLKGEEIPEKDRNIIERMHRLSEHKRNMAIAPPKF